MIWTNGSANSQWGISGNWSSGVPTSSSNVQFNSTAGGVNPVGDITLDGNRVANSLTFNNVDDNFSLLNGSSTSALRLTSRTITRTSGSSGNQTIAIGTLAPQNDWDAGWTWAIAGAGSLTISSVITGGYANNTKSGNGTLILSGNNTYSGITYINEGVLVAASNTALGSATYGNVIANGAALHLQNNITLQEDNFQVTGSGISGTGAIRNLSGNNTLNSSLNFGGATTIGSDAGTLTVTNQLALDYNVTTTGAGNIAFSGSINGSNGIIKNGTGTLTLSGTGANSFGGTLAINDGTVALAKTAGTNAVGNAPITIGDGVGAAGSAVLRLDANNQIADYSGLITINSDGRLTLNNFTESVNTIGGTGRIDLGTSGSLTVGINSGSSTFGGSFAGTGTFTKAGSGTLDITSNASINGVFNLAAGTLKLSDIVLTVGTLNITGNSTIDFAGVDASLYVTTLNIASGVTLTVLNWNEATDHFYATNWNGAVYNATGAPMNQIVFNGYSSNNGASTHWNSYDSQITPVPEPSTYGALLLGAMTGLFAWRRLRKK